MGRLSRLDTSALCVWNVASLFGSSGGYDRPATVPDTTAVSRPRHPHPLSLRRLIAGNVVLGVVSR